MNKKTYRFTQEDNMGKREISTESMYVETLSVEQLLGMFRQYIILLGYSEESAKQIVMIDGEDMTKLGIDPTIYDWDSILK